VLFFGSAKTEAKARDFITRLEQQIGGWVRGELALMIIIGLLTYIGLKILGVNYALPLSIIAGLLEIIPNIGPTIALIPAVLVALTSSPVTALATVALYFLIQQFENNIIVPKIMQRAVGVKPLIVIIALMTGAKLAGVLGAALAVPGYLVLKVVIEEIYASDRFQKS
jgi:predicted PurR-regulated permease PerM